MAKAYGATRLILFGSALDVPEQSRDIDLACDGIPGWKIYEFAAKLEDELGALLDIVPVNPPTRPINYLETL